MNRRSFLPRKRGIDGELAAPVSSRNGAAFEAERDPSLRGAPRSARRLLALTERNEDAIVAAIAADFGTRPAQETRLAELFMVSAGIRHARRHLARWMAPRRVHTPLYLQPGTSRLVRQPLGVVGVISPWNYPFQLAMLPAVAAIAAGNRVMLKPSELTPRTSALLESSSARISPSTNSRWSTAERISGRRFRGASLRSPVLHRFDRRRTQDRARRGREPDAGHAGAGRQVTRARS